MINDLPEWLGNTLIVAGIQLLMGTLIAVLAAIARWALLGEKPSDYDRWKEWRGQ